MKLSTLLDLIARHQLTPHHAAVEAALLVTDSNVDEVLSVLPPNVRAALEDFAETYEPGRMLSNYGDIPSPASVESINNWFMQQKAKGDLPVLH
jgi:hypothetical protein